MVSLWGINWYWCRHDDHWNIGKVINMKNIYSFGGGINSVAMVLLGGFDEIVFCDTGSEWPETYEYLEMFSKLYPITVLKPKDGNIYDYCWKYKMVPALHPRWCSFRFKREPFEKYVEKPCFKSLGFDEGESQRAVISMEKGIENRYPLLEAHLNRRLCIDLIRSHGLPIPHKSSCFMCPQMTIAEWKDLRLNHPDLFCKAEQLEKRNMEYRISQGKTPMYLYSNKKPLRVVVDENQEQLFKRDKYPPCECML